MYHRLVMSLASGHHVGSSVWIEVAQSGFKMARLLGGKNIESRLYVVRLYSRLGMDVDKPKRARKARFSIKHITVVMEKFNWL